MREESETYPVNQSMDLSNLESKIVAQLESKIVGKMNERFEKIEQRLNERGI